MLQSGRVILYSLAPPECLSPMCFSSLHMVVWRKTLFDLNMLLNGGNPQRRAPGLDFYPAGRWCFHLHCGESTGRVQPLCKSSRKVLLMWPWYLQLLTYSSEQRDCDILCHSSDPEFGSLLFGSERSVFSCSSISTARPDRGACITARGGSALWQFTLFTCYYDGNAALFLSACSPKRSLLQTKAETARKIKAELPVNIVKRMSSSKSMFCLIKKH